MSPAAHPPRLPHPPARLRPAVPGDLDALVALERELFGPDAWSPALVGAELDAAAGRWVLVAEVAGQVAGYAVLAVSDDVADLLRIGVAPGARRTGLARRLLAAGTEAVVGAGADRMLLEVSATNAPATAFYAAAGFREIHRRPRYYRDGADALVLQRRLPA
ncbi:ribosomal protein S18-alanine N-acetyltransferase [Nocardioides zeae]|uniref:Ribosomal protein S18-alanine N-acetyltransferase n=1 Tax=Nocardioides imazamoxiresistens TaxID=3231893 RepID=A0ABU3PR72_9ACTN|nr:ribosomal protein S18-alanine N-acetyltransferase [Nocardioides zeae]MDT9591736.1 ribosomal protein S18-alanine N-acetyltransferase [Nocardioides zeae]